MTPVTTRVRAIAVNVVLVLATLAAPAVAGPPLLCHPFDIGDARSLPWDGSSSWFQGRADYNLANLVHDTDSLLTPATPVIVRMETIRRAAIYASQDRGIATALFARFGARAQEAASPAGRDPLASLDAALLTETFRQLAMLGSSTAFRDRAEVARVVVGTNDGRALMARALAARPDDAAVQFAAALMTADKDRRAYDEHARKARAGAGSNPLLARNLKYVS
jgi:hypothetical protein